MSAARVIEQAATLVVLGGLAVAVAATLRGQWRAGVAGGLALWTAAAVLRLSADATWEVVAVAAVVVVVGRVLSRSLLVPP